MTALLAVFAPFLFRTARVRPLASATSMFLAVGATTATPTSGTLPVPITGPLTVPVPVAVYAVPAPVSVPLAVISVTVRSVERTAPRAAAVEPCSSDTGRCRRLVMLVHPSSRLQMFVARVGETLHHGFGALGRIYGYIRGWLHKATLSAFKAPV